MTLGKLQQAWSQPTTDLQQMHMDRISEACELLRAYLHEAEGTQMPGPGDKHHWQRRSMMVADDHLSVVEIMARKGVLE